MARYLLTPGDFPVRQILHTDESDDMRLGVEIQQDTNIVRAAAARAREHGPDSTTGELRLLAEVPMTEYLRACTEGWVNDESAWKRWLNDPDNRDCRVHSGRA